MSPDCTCSTGKCDFHTHILHGKLVHLYRINPKFAYNYDSMYSIMAEAKMVKGKSASPKPIARKTKTHLLPRDTSALRMISDRRKFPDPPQNLSNRASEAFRLVDVPEITIKRWLGVSCPCKERREKLNRLGSWITLALSGHISTEQAKKELDLMLGGGT